MLKSPLEHFITTSLVALTEDYEALNVFYYFSVITLDSQIVLLKLCSREKVTTKLTSERFNFPVPQSALTRGTTIYD
jgi:hypothetical protein